MKTRRYDIDWIRVIVFDILIFWHVGLYFVKWGTPVDWDLSLKNNVQVSWLSWPMLFVRQWRLPVLFVISGIGTQFALSSRTAKEYLRERFIRLLFPLFAGILLIVPPMVYLERITEGTFDSSFWSFYPQFFDGIYPEGNFSWHHLWFLAYLFLMSALALPLFLYLRRSGRTLFIFMDRSLRLSPFFLFILTIPLIIIQLTMETRFPLTMALVDDWYAFSYYLICFVWGFILASMGEQSWNVMREIRRYALICGLALSMVILLKLHRGENPVWIRILKPINTWSWIIVLFGYASKYLNRESAVLRYRNTAVYPFYILHFTILIFLGYKLQNSSLHYAWKMLIMVVGTYGSCFLIYELLLSRINFLRPFFGLKPKS